MKFWKYTASMAFLLVTGLLYAFPQAPVDSLDFQPEVSSFANSYDFSAIVKLSNCSGSLVIFEGQNMDARGIVLTNGHCVPKGFFGGLIGPQEVIVDKKVKRKMELFKDLDNLHQITTTKIIYATMVETDMALYELNESYQEILNRTGVSPLILSSKRPVEGMPIEIISGYWRRGYSCGIDQFVYHLQEGEYLFKDSLRYTNGCNTIGGTSGSPIIDPSTREVIAINNSANENGRRCSMNNPCEVDEQGDVLVLRGAKYGQQTYKVYSCLNGRYELSLSKRGCLLPKG